MAESYQVYYVDQLWAVAFMRGCPWRCTDHTVSVIKQRWTCYNDIPDLKYRFCDR